MEFTELVRHLVTVFSSLGAVTTKKINYGMQIALTDRDKKVTLNVYNGRKGVKYVWGGGETSLRARAEALAAETFGAAVAPLPRASTRAGNLDWTPPQGNPLALSGGLPGILLRGVPAYEGIWMGSDESGKGDYLGPLAVAAVALDEASAKALIAAGVRDCKALGDARIRALAPVIRAKARACTVQVLLPDQYNDVYGKYRAQGKTLNVLLMQAHANVLEETAHRDPACRLALIDQFMESGNILRFMRAACPAVTVYCRPRAEADIAVAAASVLARAAFLEGMDRLAAEAGLAELPKGGGSAATDAARRLVQRLGREALPHFAKLHFANTMKV